MKESKGAKEIQKTKLLMENVGKKTKSTITEGLYENNNQNIHEEEPRKPSDDFPTSPKGEIRMSGNDAYMKVINNNGRYVINTKLNNNQEFSLDIPLNIPADEVTDEQKEYMANYLFNRLRSDLGAWFSSATNEKMIPILQNSMPTLKRIIAANGMFNMGKL